MAVRTSLILLLGTVHLFTSLLAQSPLEQAVTLARERRYSEANEMLQGVAPPSETNQRIAFYRLKAAIASGLNDPATAVREMRSALALSPQDPALLLGTAMAEFQAHSLDDALQHAQQAGNLATAQALIGDIQEKRGNFVEAAKAFREAVVLAPDREQYRIALGLELIQHQSFTPAIEMLKNSAPLFPKSAKIRTLLGIAQYANGYTKDAEESLQDAIAVDPKLESAYRCLAQIVLQSSAAPPQPMIDSLCAWNAVVCSALKLRIAREANDTAVQSEAIAVLKRAASNNAIARCELGRAYEWKNDLAQARTQMEACVRLDPSPQNHYRLGLIYKRLGESELAQKQMELRNQILQKMSEETALGLNALQSFEYSGK